MRFGMQVHELEVDVPDGKLTLADIEKVTRDFVAKYEQTYGQDSAYTAAGIEYVNFRVSGTLDMERPVLDVKGHATNGAGLGRRAARRLSSRPTARSTPKFTPATSSARPDLTRSCHRPAFRRYRRTPPGHDVQKSIASAELTITWQEKAR